MVLTFNLCLQVQLPTFSQRFHHYPPHPAVAPPIQTHFRNNKLHHTTTRATRNQRAKKEIHPDKYVATSDDVEDEEEYYNDFLKKSKFGGGENDKDYDRDPEFGEILGDSLEDPDKARSKVEERLRKKRNKILHTKTGSATPMKVIFNKFDFSNSYIWFEFYHAPLETDITLLCDTIRSWHIIGRLGGCNSMNMQLSQAPLDQRPSYDPIQGANVNPTTFYNIGDLEIQHNLARIWVDIGTGEHLLLDVLVNALTQISSDYVGIKQVIFGGSEFDNWIENLTSEDPGYAIRKI